MTMQDLIARLEKAGAPDFELDWDILQALGWSKFWNMRTIYLPPGETEEVCPNATVDMPRPTASLDDALTLVLEGWHWSAGYRDHNPHYGWTLDGPRDEEIDGDHNVAAIALCIAALKARAAISSTAPVGGETR